ncbi:SapC family protein, partial [Porticoccaceae bacterium]|nr:SapC family protein [Porticoccaceae bacterium]
GNISKDTQSMIDFSVQYEHDRLTTQNFMKTMLSLDLLSEQHVGQSVDGKDRTFANFISINGEKFNALSSEHLASLHEKGYLAFIFGQLFSQEHWGKLISRIPPSAS